ncbi:hypothetical protein F2Q68_00025444 [Brassica cretica]|uniref:Helicase C-terminal domain-containing protein n=1 Tax=Brassica cretica TaxID=69181 RepID=A0A8S9I7Z8_BRACR|nr:hypothetical protein F2Q68_00025444 [Brassica cretica]
MHQNIGLRPEITSSWYHDKQLHKPYTLPFALAQRRSGRSGTRWHSDRADFSSCVVDFLHRIGRTARAGQYGTVTSLYTEASHDLVEAIREAVKDGSASGIHSVKLINLETAFSRKRGFRNKLKKRAFLKGDAKESQALRV